MCPQLHQNPEDYILVHRKSVSMHRDTATRHRSPAPYVTPAAKDPSGVLKHSDPEPTSVVRSPIELHAEIPLDALWGARPSRGCVLKREAACTTGPPRSRSPFLFHLVGATQKAV